MNRIAGGIALLATIGCTAHLQRVDEPIVELEPMWIGAPLAKGQFFEAQFPLHLFLHDGLDQPRAMDDGGFAAVLSFTVLGTVRMQTTQSTPILPPSYQPRLRLQLVNTVPLGSDGGGTVHRLVSAFQLTAAHYSNGQMGCALQGGTPRPGATSDFDCIWPAGGSPSGVLNLENGSFTGHMLGAGVLLRWLAFPSAGGASRGGVTASFAADWSLPCDFSGCLEPQMRARYGAAVLRWLASGELVVIGHRHRGIPIHGRIASDARLRLTASGAVHVGLGAGRTPFGDASCELAYLTHFERGGSGGPFVRFHAGRDPLNIRFEERWDVWTVGYLLEFSAPLMLAGPSRAASP